LKLCAIKRNTLVSLSSRCLFVDARVRSFAYKLLLALVGPVVSSISLSAFFIIRKPRCGCGWLSREVEKKILKEKSEPPGCDGGDGKAVWGSRNEQKEKRGSPPIERKRTP
jgi:hypothetical protein